MTDEAKQSGPAPRWFNFTPRPHVPEWIDILLKKEDSSNYIFTKLSEEGFLEFAAWWWIQEVVDTPARLEEWNKAFKPYVSQFPDLEREFNRVYEGMWTHFTGNVEAVARGEV